MLKGEAKKTYQREYMRGYMRVKRALLRPSTSNPVKTPEYIERPAIIMPKPIFLKGKTTTNAKGKGYIVIPEIDADGSVIYEE